MEEHSKAILSVDMIFLVFFGNLRVLEKGANIPFSFKWNLKQEQHDLRFEIRDGCVVKGLEVRGGKSLARNNDLLIFTLSDGSFHYHFTKCLCEKLDEGENQPDGNLLMSFSYFFHLLHTGRN